MTIHRETTAVRRHQILEAATSLILDRGVEALTMDALADAVHLSEGAIYRHFSGKQQILDLVVEDMERALLGVLDRAEIIGAPALENLERVLDAHLNTAEERRATSFIVISHAMAFEGLALGSRVSAMTTRYLDHIKRMIKQGLQEGTIRPDVDPDAAATTFFGIIQSTATLWALNDYTQPLAEHRTQMWEIFKQGVATPPSPVPGPKQEETGAKTPTRLDAPGRSQ
ncbi:MAG: TetR/AcrR family transcriptional regulator [Dehalococcoidia bacterium]